MTCTHVRCSAITWPEQQTRQDKTRQDKSTARVGGTGTLGHWDTGTAIGTNKSRCWCSQTHECEGTFPLPPSLPPSPHSCVSRYTRTCGLRRRRRTDNVCRAGIFLCAKRCIMRLVCACHGSVWRGTLLRALRAPSKRPCPHHRGPRPHATALKANLIKQTPSLSVRIPHAARQQQHSDCATCRVARRGSKQGGAEIKCS